MLGLITFELTLLAAMWLVFIGLMTFHQVDGRVRIIRWWKKPFSTQLVGIAILGLIESVALIAAATNHRPSLWVFVGIFGAVDIITARWLYLIWKARKVVAEVEDDRPNS